MSRLSLAAVGAAAAIAGSAAGLTMSSAAQAGKVGPNCPADFYVKVSQYSLNGYAAHVESSCDYQVEAAVEWRICLPNDQLGQDCSAPLWAYGNDVSSDGATSKVNVGDAFGMQTVNDGYRFRIGSKWILQAH